MRFGERICNCLISGYGQRRASSFAVVSYSIPSAVIRSVPELDPNRCERLTFIANPGPSSAAAPEAMNANATNKMERVR